MLTPRPSYSSPVVSIFMWLVRIILTWEKCLNISVDWGFLFVCLFYSLKSRTAKHCFDSFAVFYVSFLPFSSFQLNLLRDTYFTSLCALLPPLVHWKSSWLKARSDCSSSDKASLQGLTLVPVARSLAVFICSRTHGSVLWGSSVLYVSPVLRGHPVCLSSLVLHPESLEWRSLFTMIGK